MAGMTRTYSTVLQLVEMGLGGESRYDWDRQFIYM